MLLNIWLGIKCSKSTQYIQTNFIIALLISNTHRRNYPVQLSSSQLSNSFLQGFRYQTGCTEVGNICVSESKVWTYNESWRVGHQAHIQPTKHEHVCWVLIVIVVSCLGSKAWLVISSQMWMLWMSPLLFQRKPGSFSCWFTFGQKTMSSRLYPSAMVEYGPQIVSSFNTGFDILQLQTFSHESKGTHSKENEFF